MEHLGALWLRIAATWRAWEVCDCPVKAGGVPGDALHAAVWRWTRLVVPDDVLASDAWDVVFLGDPVDGQAVQPFEGWDVIVAMDRAEGQALALLEPGAHTAALREAGAVARALVPALAPTWPGRRDWLAAGLRTLCASCSATVGAWQRAAVEQAPFACALGWLSQTWGLLDVELLTGGDVQAAAEVEAAGVVGAADFVGAVELVTQLVLAELAASPEWHATVHAQQAALRAMAVEAVRRGGA